MRNAAVFGLVVIAALLPFIALPLVIVCAEAALILVAAVAISARHARPPVALLALPLFRAPPSL